MLRSAFTRLLGSLALVSLAAPASAITFSLDTTMEIDLRNPLGAAETVTLTGTTVWDVPFEGPTEGTPMTPMATASTTSIPNFSA